MTSKKRVFMLIKCIILFLLFCIASFQSKAQSFEEPRYILKGEIKNFAPYMPKCSRKDAAFIFEFEVLEYSDTSYKKPTIGVIVGCPGCYETNFFEIGKKYSINIIQRNKKDFPWYIVNKKVLDKYDKCLRLAGCIEKIE